MLVSESEKEGYVSSVEEGFAANFWLLEADRIKMPYTVALLIAYASHKGHACEISFEIWKSYQHISKFNVWIDGIAVRQKREKSIKMVVCWWVRKKGHLTEVMLSWLFKL